MVYYIHIKGRLLRQIHRYYMEENKEGMNTCNCGCGCGKEHGMMGHGRWIAKKIVMILVLLVVFWFGTKLGELRTLMRYSSEPRSMMSGGEYGGYGTRMMMVNPSTTTTVSGTPAAQ